MTEPGTGSTQIVWSDHTGTAIFSRFADYGPNYLRSEPTTSNTFCLSYRAEERSVLKLRRICPRIDCRLHPTGHRDRAHVAAFANEICKHPVFFSKLEVLNLNGNELCSAQAAAQKHGQHCVVTQVAQLLAGVNGEQLFTLFRAKPVPNSNAQPLCSFDPANASGEVRTQESTIRSLICEPANRS